MTQSGRNLIVLLAGAVCLAAAPAANAAPPKPKAPAKPAKPPKKKPKKRIEYKAYTDEASAGIEWQLMGDYQGAAGTTSAAQVLALGDGEFSVNMLAAFDKRSSKSDKAVLAVLTGRLDGEKIELTGKASKGPLAGTRWTATIEGSKLTGRYTGPKSGTFEMKKLTRVSPTMGAKPPAGAVVLFDGTGLDEWTGAGGKPLAWEVVDGIMQAVPGKGSVISKRKFTNHKVHVEFRSPFMPKARGQRRGNSGVYLLGRYEVQVLDSYALSGEDNECGGIYKVAAPRVNMCAPPLVWQTYDITFRAPSVKGGKVVEPGRISVAHNGVTIHENVALRGGTKAALAGRAGPGGGLYLQDHRDPVQYRNIWVVELKE